MEVSPDRNQPTATGETPDDDGRDVQLLAATTMLVAAIVTGLLMLLGAEVVRNVRPELGTVVAAALPGAAAGAVFWGLAASLVERFAGGELRSSKAALAHVLLVLPIAAVAGVLGIVGTAGFYVLVSLVAGGAGPGQVWHYALNMLWRTGFVAGAGAALMAHIVVIVSAMAATADETRKGLPPADGGDKRARRE